MTSSDLEERLKSKYSKMTKSEKKIASFIMEYPEKTLNSTITELSKFCNVGETSVFRFCKTLNFNGYQEFRLSLALSRKRENKTDLMKDIESSNSSFKMERNLGYEVFLAYESALKDSYASLDYKIIKQVVELLVNSSHVYLFGVGESGITAMEMHAKFARILPHISYDIDFSQQLMKASLISESHLAFIFSNSGMTKDSINIAKLCHGRNAKVVFVTKFENTQAAKYCDIILQSGAIESPLDGGTTSAKLSQQFMVDVLFKEVENYLGQKALENKKLTAEAIISKML